MKFVAVLKESLEMLETNCNRSPPAAKRIMLAVLICRESFHKKPSEGVPSKMMAKLIFD